MESLGKTLIIFGIILIALGAFLVLGKLPGDIYIEKKNFSFYFPIATSILVSLAISLILWLFSRR